MVLFKEFPLRQLELAQRVFQERLEEGKLFSPSEHYQHVRIFDTVTKDIKRVEN
jgi:hypothetical protein